MLTIFFLGLVSLHLYADDLLIKNARIYTLTDTEVIERGDILIKDGKILQVGSDIKSPAGTQIIDADGKQITPGLFTAYTYLGVTEIDAVSGTLDVATTDTSFGASFAIAPAVNPNSTLFPLNLTHGLTHALVAPRSGHHVFAGQGALIRLADANSVMINDSVAVYADYGSESGKFAGGSRAAAYIKIRQSLLDAREFGKNRQAVMKRQWRELSLPVHDLEALQAVVNGDKPLVINVHRASDIRALLKLQTEFGLRLIINGASEAWMVANELADAEVPVIMDPINNLPLSFDRLGARLDSAARLHKAGVTVLFSSQGSPAAHTSYLVRQSAGNAVAHGMPAIAAIRAMTLNTAQVFNVADRFGSIATGKSADLVIWDGDPLEVTTRADQVIMDGKLVPMVSRSTRLRDRYRDLDPDKPHAYRK